MSKRIYMLVLVFLSFNTFSNPIELGQNFINTENVNVRELPNSDTDIVGKKIFRQIVYVKELKGEWARISHYKFPSNDNNRDLHSEWVLIEELTSTQPERQEDTFLSTKSKYEENAINEQIMRSSRGDKGRYFLVYIEGGNGKFTAISKRISAEVVGYSKVEINCGSRVYRELGYTERHIEYFANAQDSPTKWTSLVDGSSKSDLVNYVCSTRR